MEPAVNPTLLKQLLTGFKFDPEVSKNLEFNDFVEQQPLPLAAICTSYNQEEEDTDQLLLAVSQAYEDKVPSEPSQQGNPAVIVQESSRFAGPVSSTYVEAVKTLRILKKTQANTLWATKTLSRMGLFSH